MAPMAGQHVSGGGGTAAAFCDVGDDGSVGGGHELPAAGITALLAATREGELEDEIAWHMLFPA